MSKPSSCFVLCDTLTPRLCAGVLIFLINAAPRTLNFITKLHYVRTAWESTDPTVNKAVNPTGATRPSIILHWTQGVMHCQSGVRVCACVCM